MSKAEERLRRLLMRACRVTSEHVGAPRDLWVQTTPREAQGARLPAAILRAHPVDVAAGEPPRGTPDERREVVVRLPVRHLRYWAIQPMPTYLVAHVGATDELLVLDVQRYVESTWGASIFRLDRQTAEIHVPRAGVLDEQALERMMHQNSRARWQRELRSNEPSRRLLLHDYRTILSMARLVGRPRGDVSKLSRHPVRWRIGTVEVCVRCVYPTCAVMADVAKAPAPEEIRRALGARRGRDLEDDLPYLTLYNPMAPLPPDIDVYHPDHHEEPAAESDPHVAFSNGDRVRVHVFTESPQFYHYLGVKLNELGMDLLEAALELQRLGLLPPAPENEASPFKALPDTLAERCQLGAFMMSARACWSNVWGLPIQAKRSAWDASLATVSLDDVEPGSTDEPDLFPAHAPSIARRPSDTSSPTVVRALRDDDTLDPDNDPGLSSDDVLALYHSMLRARLLDATLHSLARHGRISSYSSCRGEEGAILGGAFAMRDDDWLFPGHREFAAALWRGMPLQRYLDHTFGNAKDPGKGRQTACHSTWKPGRIVSVGSPLGARITQAAGFALAAKLRRGGEAAVVYLGDGLTSSSEFHSGMNFAGLFKAPAVFMCRNNGWAQSTPTERQTAAETFARKAIAYGMPGVRVDGSDVFAVIKVTRDALSRASRGEGPTFLEALTYRFSGHTLGDEPKVHRAARLEIAFRGADPLPRLRRYIMRHEGWTDSLDQDLASTIDGEIEAAVKAAQQTPPPPLESLFEDVFAEPPWHLAEQRDLVLGRRRPG